MLKGVDGYNKLLEFLSKEFGEEETYDVFNKFEEFESLKKVSGQSMQQYISGFEQKYSDRLRIKDFLSSLKSDWFKLTLTTVIKQSYSI